MGSPAILNRMSELPVNIDGFLPGKNVIEIDVWNGIYHFSSNTQTSVPSPNPMSIRVEWQAFGIPETDREATSQETI